jgi:hypothetical protein
MAILLTLFLPSALVSILQLTTTMATPGMMLAVEDMEREGTFYPSMEESERIQAGFENDDGQGFFFSLEYEDTHHPFKTEVVMTNRDKFSGEVANIIRDYVRLADFSEGYMIFRTDGYTSSSNEGEVQEYVGILPVAVGIEYFRNMDIVAARIAEGRAGLISRYNSNSPKETESWRDTICMQQFRNRGTMEQTVFELSMSSW